MAQFTSSSPRANVSRLQPGTALKVTLTSAPVHPDPWSVVHSTLQALTTLAVSLSVSSMPVIRMCSRRSNIAITTMTKPRLL